MSIPVGLNVWSRLAEETFPYLDYAAGPFDSVWFPDHVQYADAKVAEGWTMSTYALARYPDKLCGHEVLCNSFRNPAHLAKMAATAQLISGGRFILGIGAGWNEEEYRAYGWPFPSARVRIAQLGEAIELMRTLWTESPANFEGKYYQISNAYNEPRPSAIPPVMIGGSGEQYLLRAVAQHADWWNYGFRDRATYAHKQAVLQEHCRTVGRDYGTIKQVIRAGILIAESEAALKKVQAQSHVRPMPEGIVGTPEQVTEQLLAVIDQGAQRLTVHFADSPRLEGTYLFAATVLPQLAQA